MSELISPTTDLQLCPTCGAKVKNLAKHQAKAHDPVRLAVLQKAEAEKRSKEIAEQNRIKLESARKIFLSTLMKCGECSQKVQLQLLPNHYFNAHGSSLPPEMRALYGLAEPKNMFKSRSERDNYWRAAGGATTERGDDIYDRGMTVQGGACELGKNRKH